MANRKLGRPSDQRMAMLRNQVTNLIWYGKIETTLARGKEVQAMAEHLITIAMRECDCQIVEIMSVNCGAKCAILYAVCTREKYHALGYRNRSRHGLRKNRRIQ